jgi:ABC-type amino acid transport substrate-binding protein
MATSLAQSLGGKLEIVKTSWSTLESDLEANSFDIAMGGITIALDRQKIGLFSNTVFSSGKVRRRLIPIRSASTLDHCRLRAGGTQIDTIGRGQRAQASAVYPRR